MKSRYILMKESDTEKNVYGQSYPDIMTYPVNKFNFIAQPLTITLTIGDIQRFDLVSYAYYDTSDYTDLILYLNNLSSYHDLNVGDKIQLPTIEDINTFFIKYSQ